MPNGGYQILQRRPENLFDGRGRLCPGGGGGSLGVAARLLTVVGVAELLSVVDEAAALLVGEAGRR